MSRTSIRTLRSLRARASRTLLTTLGVVLGVAVILAISITNRSTLDSIARVFRETSGKAHLVVTSSSSGDRGFGEAVLRRVVTVPGVKAAIPSLHVQALLTDEAPPSEFGIRFFGGLSGHQGALRAAGEHELIGRRDPRAVLVVLQPDDVPRVGEIVEGLLGVDGQDKKEAQDRVPDDCGAMVRHGFLLCARSRVEGLLPLG